MTRLFLDTGVLVALVNPRDAHHARAAAILDRIVEGEWKSVHTSDLVVVEAMNFIARKLRVPGPADAVTAYVFGADGAPPVVTDVARIHAARFATTATRFRKHFDSGLSFTDWSSLVLMEEERIPQIATFDGGFTGRVDVVDG